MRRARQRMTDQQWRRVFQRQRSSGLSIAAFCERERVASSTFFAKRRELEAGSGVPACDPCDRGATSAAMFVEVTPDDDRVDDRLAAYEPEAASAADTADEQPLELVLRGGVLVRVRSGFDASLLRRLVDVIGGAT